MTARQRRDFRDGVVALVLIVGICLGILYSLSVTESVRAYFQ